jgi:hypothetical protein
VTASLVAFILWHLWNCWVLFNNPRTGTMFGCLASSLFLIAGWQGQGYAAFLTWEVLIAVFEVGGIAFLMSRLARGIEEAGEMSDEVMATIRRVVRATAAAFAIRVAAALIMVGFFLQE